MRPYVICHMATSIDGRILPARWHPENVPISGVYEEIHQKLGGDAWIVGRTTGQEFSKRTSYPQAVAERVPREPWLARRDAGAYGIVLDAHGKIAWGRSDVGGDPIVVVLTEQVSDAHLVGLRSEGVSYVFAGTETLDVSLALEVLSKELGIQRLLLEGGGVTNGAFLRAGVVDEVSLLIIPAVDGVRGAPSLFDSRESENAAAADIQEMQLESCKVLDNGVAWLRYRIVNILAGDAVEHPRS